MPITTPPRSTSIKPPSSIRQRGPGVGDFNVMPTNLGVYAPEHWCDNALCRPWALVAAYLCLGSTGEQYFFRKNLRTERELAFAVEELYGNDRLSEPDPLRQRDD